MWKFVQGLSREIYEMNNKPWKIAVTLFLFHFSFNPKTDDEKHSNMVVMEVSMPSGFLIDNDRLTELLDRPHIKLAHLKNGETVADVYIDQMLPNQVICLAFHGYRSHKVAENKPVPVRIYDYYDSCTYLNISFAFLLVAKLNNTFFFILFLFLLQPEAHANSMKFHQLPHVTFVKATNAQNHVKNNIKKIAHRQILYVNWN